MNQTISIAEQYYDLCDKYKQEYGQNVVVFLQVGDFYEMYKSIEEDENNYRGADLDLIHSITDLKITIKHSVKKPYYLSGCPLNLAKLKIELLLKESLTVVVYDQDENDCKIRKFSQIFSPSVNIDEQIKDGNYLIVLNIQTSLTLKNEKGINIGICAIDINLSNIYYFETSNIQTYILDVSNFYNKYNSHELIVYERGNDNFIEFNKLGLVYNKIQKFKEMNENYEKSSYQEKTLKSVYKHLNIMSFNKYTPTIDYLNLLNSPYALTALIAAFDYISKHTSHFSLLDNLKIPQKIDKNSFMFLGNNAQEQLHITAKFKYYKYNSINDLVNKCLTPMGYRYLKDKLISPFIEHDKIMDIYEKTELLLSDNDNINNFKQTLKNTYDIERILRKIITRYIEPDEAFKLYDSLEKYNELFKSIKESKLKKKYKLKKLIEKINQIMELINTKFNVDMLKNLTFYEVNQSFYKKNIYEDLDKLDESKQDTINNLNLMLEMFKKIDPTLKITLKKQKKREEYYFGLSLKQGLKLKECMMKCDKFTFKNTNNNEIELNVKDFIFEELKSQLKIKCIKVMEHSQNNNSVLQLLKKKLMMYLSDDMKYIYNTYENTFNSIIENVIDIDYVLNNASNSLKLHYTKPILVNNKNSFINAKGIRHPLSEKINEEEYKPHDVVIDDNINGLLIYGVNGSGKSILMKAMGINLIMAQCGLYCACERFEYSIFTSLYTRISGDDNLHKSRSSFDVEMIELNEIIKNADKKCLIIGDEICRGTETVSAIGIVAATLKHLTNVNSKFLFATHLHDLLMLDDIKNLKTMRICHISMTQRNNELIFDRILKDGSGIKNYGIDVLRYHVSGNKNFIDMAVNYTTEILKQRNYQFDDKKTSNYNKNLYMDECEKCGSKYNLHTHHINEQHNFINGIDKNNLHLHKNNLYNISVLCESCHTKIHSNEDTNVKKINTTSGFKIV